MNAFFFETQQAPFARIFLSLLNLAALQIFMFAICARDTKAGDECLRVLRGKHDVKNASLIQLDVTSDKSRLAAASAVAKPDYIDTNLATAVSGNARPHTIHKAFAAMVSELREGRTCTIPAARPAMAVRAWGMSTPASIASREPTLSKDQKTLSSADSNDALRAPILAVASAPRRRRSPRRRAGACHRLQQRQVP